jgi:hypothetical protein
MHCGARQAAWSAREKELQEEHTALSTKLRLQADLSHKADQAAQAKVRHTQA